MKTVLISSVAILISLLFTGFVGNAQNINIPNKTGPMGLEVNSYTGNLFFERTDLVIPGTGLDMNISFSYNSYNFDSNRGFGNGWSYLYDMQYQVDSLNNIVIINGDGREDTYEPVGGGNFQSPTGFFTVFKEYEPGKFSLTDADGIKYLFDNNSHSRLTKIQDLNGNFIAINHTDTLITSVTNNYGQTISFVYDSRGFLTTVTDAITSPSRSWTYSYDGVGNLTSVTDPLGAKDAYSYMINGPVKTVTDKNFNVVNLVYYNDFSLSEMVGCNKRMSFSYDTTQKLTVVTDHLESGENQVNKYFYTQIGKLTWLSAIAGNCCGFDAKIEYDQQGNKIKQTDANGNETTYTYDDRGNILTKTNPLGEVTTFSYLADFNQISTITDPKGQVTKYEYDQKGNMIKLIEADNSAYTATYNADGNMISSTNPNGEEFVYTYDAHGNLKSLSGPEGLNMLYTVSPRNELLEYTDPNNQSKAYQYDIMGRLIQFTDPLNDKVVLSYDAIGNLIGMRNKKNEKSVFNYDASNRLRKIINPLGNKSVIGYDAMDNVISFTDAEGAETQFAYNDKDLLSSLKDAEGNETTFSYDRDGNLITVNFPFGQSVTYTYDKLRRIRSATDANGIIGSLDYDVNGNISKYTDASGAITTFEYDGRNRIKKSTDPLGNFVELTYNKNSKVKTIRNRNGQVSSYTYDNLNRVKTYTDGVGGITKVGYDAAGNITSLTDANNNVTTYTYDALNRVAGETFPDGKFTAYTYDAKNNILSFREKDGSISNYTYDSLSRIKTKTLPDGNVFSYEYDALGRILSATNNVGIIYFEYDFLNRIISESFNGRKIFYNYDVSGKSQTTVYPDSTVIVKTYDERNRLKSIKKNNDVIANYQYNNNNQIISKSYSNNITTSLQYDFAGQLTGITTGDFQNVSFTYDKMGNKTSVLRGDTNLSEFFTYDSGNRLVSYKKGKTGGPFIVNDTYSYDALGNRVSANIGGENISYTTNNLNQIISQIGGAKTTNYTYDANGNLTFDGKYFKTYNFLKQLVKDSASPAEVINYQYDALGRRIAKTIHGITSYFTYSGISPIEERNGDGILKNRIIYKGFLEPVANDKNEVPYYYHQNDIFNIEALTNASGSLSESYQYDVYGKQTIYDASGNVLQGSITGNLFGFTGQLYDSSTGSNQFFFRNYNPQTGLFNQQDLIGYEDGMGLYHYTHNNPGSMIDPLGLAPCPPKPEKKISMDERIMNWVENIGTGAGTTSLVIDFLYKGQNTTLTLMKAGGEGVGNIFGVISGTYSTVQLANNYSTNNAATNTDLATGAVMSFTGTGLTLAILASAAEAPVAAAVGTGLAVYGALNAGSKILTGKSAPEHLYPISDAVGDAWATEFYETPEFNKNYGYLLHTQGYERAELYARIYKEKISKRIYKGDPCPESTKPNGTQRPRGKHNEGTTGRTEVIQSNDPNEIIGPIGQPDKRWVSVNERLPYTVTYENSEMASAPAKYVKVIVPVHEKMDPSTFQLSNLGFNNMTFTTPQASVSDYQRLDARDSMGLLIDMTAGFDQMKNEFFWEFQTIDPVTLMPPTDPLKGFLLLQDTTEVKTNNGHGFVNFSVKPMANAKTLDSILAFASIVFDLNDTIPTNIEKNVIDAVAPTSQLGALSGSYSNFIPLNWSGQDDPNGCGVRSYTLYVSTDGENFSIVKTGITRTDTTFTAEGNTRYYFFVLATDSVGNTELLRPGAVKNTFLGSVLPVSWLYFKGTNREKDNLLEWATANEVNTKEYRVERSFDGQSFAGIGQVKASGNRSGNSSYQFTDYGVDRLGESVMYYRLAQIDVDGRTNLSNVIRLNYTSNNLPKTIVYPNPTKGLITVVLGDPTVIGTNATLYDEAGKLLQSVKVTSMNLQFNLSSYTNGIYFIKLANKEVLKIMKQ